MLTDPYAIFNELRDSYLRYYESAFDLRDDTLAKERRSLLSQEGIIYREPYIELVPRYKLSGKSISHGIQELNIHSQVAEFIQLGLFPSNRQLYTHQWETWKASWEGQNTIVTSGTGSGKTEAFLIPIIARLVEESRNWEAPASLPSSPWWMGRGQWELNRSHERRSAAVRALILYPMNALVEDQLQRLRRSLGSKDVWQWLDRYRMGNRFTFGRYTGRTKVAGYPNQSSHKINELREYLKKEHLIIEGIKQQLRDATSDIERRNITDTLYYFGNPLGSEMLSRWDMQKSPPDILITNYSMLNVALMRDVEDSIWDQTRQWLEEDPHNIFTLVVDELHTYRGTTGTEVALILRNLYARLGLWERPHQLRIIAASASINNDNSGRNYVAQFFGLPAQTFNIISEQRDIPPNTMKDLSQYASGFITFLQSQGTEEDESALAKALNQSDVNDSVIYNALTGIQADATLLGAAQDNVSGQRKAQSFQVLSERLFPNIAGADQNLALGGLLRAFSQARNASDEMLLPIRLHYFFRNIQGLWACTNRRCSAVEPHYQYDQRNIGKLFFSPRVQCSCGSRVVDVLYCQTCGELFLGGYKGIIDKHDENNSWSIVPDQPNLQDLPDKAIHQRSHATYTLYWPSRTNPVDTTPWERSGKNDDNSRHRFKCSFVHAYLDDSLGSISRAAPADEWTGWLYLVEPKGDTDPTLLNKIPPFPVMCPRCGDDWEGDKRLSVTDTERTRSPIRTMRTGFEKINQVLADCLIRQMPVGFRKLVLFSDSRQDAAKLSAGLEKSHFTDIIRQVVVQATSKLKVNPHLFLRYARDEDLASDEEVQAREYEQLFPTDAGILRRSIRRKATDEDIAAAQSLLSNTQRPISLSILRGEVERRLLALGVNPAGPDPEFQEYKDGNKKIPWTKLVNWNNGSQPEWQQPGNLSDMDTMHLNTISNRALREVMYMLFAHQRRDIESLGLGWCTFDPNFDIRPWTKGINADKLREVCDATIRILADHNRMPVPPPRKSPAPQSKPPKYLQNYWDEVSKHIKVPTIELESAVVQILAKAKCVIEFIIQPSDLFLHIKPISPAWICERCGQIHLHQSAGICTDCHNLLPSDAKIIRSEERPQDYYAFLANSEMSGPPFRLNCQELTGQTNRDDAQKRQRLFQDVALRDKDEIALVDTVDLLSVTTTMEAGVDIGALLAIMLSNMPPMRFNYQQRVGRAGRRGSGLSIALTVCRGRSHDDFYFQYPSRITSDPPPQPYLDLRRKEIFQRVLAAESLRRAFRGCSIPVGDEDEWLKVGNNVHGQFGASDEWGKWESRIRTWLLANERQIYQILDDLLHEAPSEIQKQRDTLLLFIRDHLCNRITESTKDPRLIQNDLSERLANAGLLPMFGFPTRVRYLYHAQPTIGNWPPERGVVDRDLSIAISQFAPGSETVKDKAVYTSIGVVDYQKIGTQIVHVDEPLGPKILVGMCKQCQALDDAADETTIRCPVCGSADDFRIIALSQPKGFCTAYEQERAFDGRFEWTARASRARMPIPKEEPTWTISPDKGYKISPSSGLILAINDNNGQDFAFQQMKGGKAWYVTDTLPQSRAYPYDVQGPIDYRALTAITDTDVLLVSLQSDRIMSGINLNPMGLPQRAAWYSFGFLLRGMAATMLDIDRQELQVGIRPRGNMPLIEADVFLADTLENGAGYATYLGQNHIFTELLDRCYDEKQRLVSHHSSGEVCDSACYDCLKDYSNMPYHGLLDWRLALDMVRLACGEEIRLDGYWKGLTEQLVNGFAKTFGWENRQFGPLPGIVRNGTALIIAHPLINKSINYTTPDLAEAIIEAEGAGFYPSAFKGWRIIDLFEVARRPAWYDTHLFDE